MWILHYFSKCIVELAFLWEKSKGITSVTIFIYFNPKSSCVHKKKLVKFIESIYSAFPSGSGWCLQLGTKAPAGWAKLRGRECEDPHWPDNPAWASYQAVRSCQQRQGGDGDKICHIWAWGKNSVWSYMIKSTGHQIFFWDIVLVLPCLVKPSISIGVLIAPCHKKMVPYTSVGHSSVCHQEMCQLTKRYYYLLSLIFEGY